MSYCVNCGVELDASSRECPLCNTPVINPRERLQQGSCGGLEAGKGERPAAFPKDKGQVETVKKGKGRQRMERKPPGSPWQR